MSEIARIKEQMQRAFKAEAWCGSSLQEALDGVTAKRAAARPVASAHSIWEIVLHVAAWKGAISQRLTGQHVALPDEGDWPAVAEMSPAAWQETLRLLEERHAQLQSVTESLTDAQLDDFLGREQDRMTGGSVTHYVTLHGILQHDLYHAGQIAILKKA